MTVLVWDEAASRYFETGVSKGIFFPIDGSVGVPWNGLVSVNLDALGGALESYYFDGKKYMDRILSEEFQAVIEAISTPTEFEACEGIRQVLPGLKTHFNKRNKFNLAWRTEIGNAESSDVAYKWHIAYNCLVQPAARSYVTISDARTPDIRSFTITTTPACGRHSYYTFDSRDHDLSALEAQLYAGVLPKCSELAGIFELPVDACSELIEDFESYNMGEVVNETKTFADASTEIHGSINNGLDSTEVKVYPSIYSFTANDSDAVEVGTAPVVIDDSDLTYVASSDGDLGYTYGLNQVKGYISSDLIFELHVRMSVTGGIDPDDPDNLDASAQIHISTDPGGDNTIGGFSDGTDEGMSFAITKVDGSIVDYVVPLDMSAWVDSTIDDVIAALGNEAYLNVVNVTNNNPDTTPEVRVYELSIMLLEDTGYEKYLRTTSVSSHSTVVQHLLTQDAIPVDQTHPNTSTVDFKVVPKIYDEALQDRPSIEAGSTVYELGVTNWEHNDFLDASTHVAGWFAVGLYHEPRVLRMQGGIRPAGSAPEDTVIEEHAVDLNVWYTVSVYWGLATTLIQVWKRADPNKIVIFGMEVANHESPEAVVAHFGGFIGDFESTMYEILIDNATLSAHCNEHAPVITPAALRPTSVTGNVPIVWGKNYEYIAGGGSVGDPENIDWLMDYMIEYSDAEHPPTSARFIAPADGSLGIMEIAFSEPNLAPNSEQPDELRMFFSASYGNDTISYKETRGTIHFGTTNMTRVVVGPFADFDADYAAFGSGDVGITPDSLIPGGGQWPFYDYAIPRADFAPGHFDAFLDEIRNGTAVVYFTYQYVGGVTADADSRAWIDNFMLVMNLVVEE